MTATPYHICLIEDEESIGETLVERLEMEGYACDWIRTGREARLTLPKKTYQIVISDICLPDISGKTLFAELLAADLPLPPFIFITGYGTIDDAVHLLKLGAADYLTKPFDVGTLLDKVRNLCQRQQPPDIDAPVLGISSAMREIVAMLTRVATSTCTVLITGESGVGKERVARALHDLRDPNGKLPFIAVNCGALTESLLEAELFGYEKGAFTGANREKKGYFEQAHGGTLFLDEIGDMPLTMQVKLLRAIQERSIVRVGGEKLVPVEIRLVCATNQYLKRMVEQGKFREDLYYRIHVIHIPVPPLRERGEDILWLAERFLDEFAAESHMHHSFHPVAKQALVDFPWPGNVRELRHCIERACILSPQPVLSPRCLFGQAFVSSENEEQTESSLVSHLRTTERNYIELALTAHQWRIKETAAAIGITRKNLWEKMKKLEISAPGEE